MQWLQKIRNKKEKKNKCRENKKYLTKSFLQRSLVIPIFYSDDEKPRNYARMFVACLGP